MTVPFAVQVRWVENKAFVGYRCVGSIYQESNHWVAQKDGNFSLHVSTNCGSRPEAQSVVEAWAVEYLGGRYV